ncbi:HlyC/CorC family transporter [Adhaeribacter swui]|uniref:HlyC/CorC family transporter n=1 Tax=Adhaeribacter swui TaxID=2086471 RepID=A0A7G7GAN6_9BACT|nr:hemolysin family protein [Adhaeribacter swui]QNF34220.1 HlyC/CorC family transporter [Adhaeribacter swui]
MEIAIIFILTLLNGFFAISEISIISVRKSRVEEKAQQGSKNARALLQLIQEPEDFLSAVQVGITLIGIISGAYGGAALTDDMQGLLSQVSFLAPYADWLALVLVIGSITYFSIVIGELIPKTLALGNAEKIAFLVAPIIKTFTSLTLPLVKILSVSTNLVIRLFGIKDSSEDKMSEDELRQLIKTAGKQGVIRRDETELHQNIFQYANQKAKNLMTHRLDTEWIDLNATLETIQEKIKQSAHTKFPICENDFNNVVGILATKDFYENLMVQHKPLLEIIKQPIYVADTMFARDVLTLFKKQKQYLGIVVDEFGATIGIITLHDILESIVGDIPDVDETDEADIVPRDEKSYLVNGAIPISDLNKALKQALIPAAAADYTTLAGFIIYQLTRLPNTGEKLAFNGYEMEIVDMDGKRIDKVILTKLEVPEDEILYSDTMI